MPQLHLLIIDDDPAIRRSLQGYFKDAGCRTTTAANGREGVAAFEQERPDVALVDLRMPEMDGLAVLRQLTPQAPDTPFIVISGVGQVEEAIDAMRHGAWDFVTKPIRDLPLLSHRLQLALEKAELRRKNHEARLQLEALVGELQTATAQLQADLVERERLTEELRALSAQLWQAAQLATLGELAASFAHEMNNPLAIIVLHLEELLEEAPAVHHHALEVINAEAERMARLVAWVLNFSRPDNELPKTQTRVGAELDAVVDLLGSRLRQRKIAVTRDYAPDAPAVLVNRDQFRQVLLNLIVNASDAMPNGGGLTLRAGAHSTPKHPRALRVEVTDTGAGIPSEQLPRIFQSFFTTKPPGEGTGLGLAICKRVVEEHGGKIDVRSVVGAGTTFGLTLPVAGN